MRLCTFALGIIIGILIGALVWASQPRPAAGRAPTVPVTEGYDWEPWPTTAPTSLLLTPEATPSVPSTSIWVGVTDGASPPAAAPPPATRKQPAQVAVPVTAQPSRGTTLRGYATWYAARGLIAAAGPALRRSLGKGWRGQRVAVCLSGRCVRVTLSDWCACGPRHGQPTLLDLSDDAFRRISPTGLSAGVLRVTVR